MMENNAKTHNSITTTEHITIIVPCYNEQEVVERFYTEVSRTLAPLSQEFTYLFINDGSRDGTLTILRGSLRLTRISATSASHVTSARRRR